VVSIRKVPKITIEERIYGTKKILGPYTNSRTGRYYVILKYKDHNVARSYAKYVMEVELGRLLYPNEVVHHINKDVTDDNILNLEVVDKWEHNSKHHKKYAPTEFTCPTCNKSFVLSGTKLINAIYNKKKGNSHRGPFCCKECAYKVDKLHSEVFVCPTCNKEFVLDSDKLKELYRARRAGRRKTGPYCSSKCSSIYVYYNYDGGLNRDS